MTNSQVDVLLTTYNQQKYITQALESLVQQQTDFAWRIIISDDGSTDGTRDICQRYADQYRDLITLLPVRTNQGRFKNLARLVKKVQAPYLAICAGDDYWLDDRKLQKQFDFLQQKKRYSICYTRYLEIYEDGQPPVVKPTPHQMTFASTSNRRNFLKRWRIASSSIFLRRHALEDLPIDQFACFEDLHLIYQALRHGRGKILNFVGTAYRLHGHNVYGSQDNLTQLTINQQVFGDLYHYYSTEPVLAKQFCYLSFNLAQLAWRRNDLIIAQKYFEQLFAANPGFFLSPKFKFYSFIHRLIGYNYQS